MAWYRTGTIAVTSGAVDVIGTGTLWSQTVAAGDALIAPDGAVHEIAAVASDTELTLAEAYAGASATAQAYAIIPVRRGATVADIADRVALLVDRYQLRLDGIYAWIAGPADGGPSQDGYFTLLDARGRPILLPSPARMQADYLAAGDVAVEAAADTVARRDDAGGGVFRAAIARAPAGAASSLSVVETDVVVAAGSDMPTGAVIPASSYCLAVSFRVLSTLGGVTGFSVGTSAEPARFAASAGPEAGSAWAGILASPAGTFVDEPVVLTADGGEFDGTGAVRLAVHTLTITAPAPA